jgi:hypothetical protein
MGRQKQWQPYRQWHYLGRLLLDLLSSSPSKHKNFNQPGYGYRLLGTIFIFLSKAPSNHKKPAQNRLYHCRNFENKSQNERKH